jgi:hypothetical protein
MADQNRRMRPFARPFGLPPLPSQSSGLDVPPWNFPDAASQAAFLQSGLPAEYAHSLTEPDSFFNDDLEGDYWDPVSPSDPEYSEYYPSFSFPNAFSLRYTTSPPDSFWD